MFDLSTADARAAIRAAHYRPEAEALEHLIAQATIPADVHDAIHARAVDLVQAIRTGSTPSMMELFLGEYGLSTEEGVALMCLAEALLRVPDGDTMDALIEDKIAPSHWDAHLGKSHSSLVNASTWALFMTRKVLEDDHESDIVRVLHGVVKRLGEPVIRQAVTRVMKELGRQFVLGETIEKAVKRAQELEAQGFTYSYDMLGEAARTDADARRYHLAYSDAIGHLAKHAPSDDIRANPGISIKLSALHPRYETLQKERVMEELLPRARALCVLAKSAGIGLNIDAEEAGRLDLSLDVIETLLSEPTLKGWDGFGIVVQAYGLRAPHVLDWLHALATRLDRKIMVRLVKGAYWDTEIKHAQVEGHPGFPVFTRKAATDVSYICCAKKLLGMTDRIYPQFATHNAHTVAAILEMASDPSLYEFQRLHGMGEALHETVLKKHVTRCRIYAPVGAHKDLLAYLVRRLLENGANSSFVNQIVDEDVPASEVAADPFRAVEQALPAIGHPNVRKPDALFDARRNSTGWDLEDPQTLDDLETGVAAHSGPWGAGDIAVTSPATGAVVGHTRFVSAEQASAACEKVRDWSDVSAQARAEVLRKAADLYEIHAHEIFARLTCEAGKTLNDCIGELREAVDFLRYYANEAEQLEAAPVGIFSCISPWNFPLAIFTGQIVAALSVGNGVLAKPAESTPLIAEFAVGLLHQAGVPKDVLILLPGTGAEVGAVLTSHTKVGGVCFTGSTATAQRINRNMAKALAPHAPLIAETGGLNAMIVDSTALPEQAIGDIIASAFQSAGQRCSALRVLYLQEDIAEGFLKMLYGAMDALVVGDPADFATDVGPVIDATAKTKIEAHIAEGQVLKQIAAPTQGTFVAPTVLKIADIADLAEEIFGPVLHVATFKASDLMQVVADINATGYGLTFGMHSRIDDRVADVVAAVEAGNIYVNRNQIGAVVGSQPFGGEGLSGTGPKAGGPRYLHRFTKQGVMTAEGQGPQKTATQIAQAFVDQPIRSTPLETRNLPGPTGEANWWSTLPRGRILCIGGLAEAHAEAARGLGCAAVAAECTPEEAATLEVDAVIYSGSDPKPYREALAAKDGPLVLFLQTEDFARWVLKERHVCVDTTAAGGNADLLAGAS
ncbi:bifunctional proline dehydrogenase/L-glutamate gamma-semialdehyde dehydrogenase PutA [Cognatishimia sp. MH4019]|uniref:bifunctional proline dehydrogenase/L-glutamate gamma-semialdehyde dehydrogenase PutA n=1 Tax=Cognatishimia sp. MH4019 TaxID=2854030 RepID=UPI001CD2637F|nr:bifunctional proline dehydrogenase/L-glutamate gamma-semialdehyde dehydrogenase PutA [Cognatishimia sp. MH4019]